VLGEQVADDCPLAVQIRVHLWYVRGVSLESFPGREELNVLRYTDAGSNTDHLALVANPRIDGVIPLIKSNLHCNSFCKSISTSLFSLALPNTRGIVEVQKLSKIVGWTGGSGEEEPLKTCTI
jgi:hypothetical protein